MAILKEIKYLQEIIKDRNAKCALKKVSTQKIRNIHLHYKYVPQDYTDFLKLIGYGKLGINELEIYDRLYSLKEVGYFPSNAIENTFKVFANDAESYFGFDTTSKEGLVYELDNFDEEEANEGYLFTVFINMLLSSIDK